VRQQRLLGSVRGVSQTLERRAVPTAIDENVIEQVTLAYDFFELVQ
jgi:hypothetical protein